ncbi:MAG: Acyl-CoA dehydrogenase FadE34 [Acidimicrobiales bacterium]|nr:MAG: acyl-CoA dehydrogenase [Actinomycetota bacterium]MBV6507694.1 Acyl-CoA dehydrogenase FadE34 [Acidimicrobiales bacterium]RIK07620.1 MAG: acyl-CoA dehydrogenase [Acidobacteriota bacterium]
MGLAITEEHVALEETARRWVESRCGVQVPRSYLDTADEPLPPFWDELAQLGWLGLHLPEEHGGQGYTLAELAVVIEQLGRVIAPGPFLASVLAAAVIDRFGSADQKGWFLPRLASGETVAAVAFASPQLRVQESPGAITVSGAAGPVLGAALADLVVLPLTGDDGRWVVVDSSDLSVTPVKNLDETRRVALVEAQDLSLSAERTLLVGDDPVGVNGLAALIFAAEAVGCATWCVDTAVEYAKIREQFGRPIGQFQAVKHRCADMLLALEQGRAATWDAARGGEPAEQALAVAVAAALAIEGAFVCAKDCIQVLGGVGFTWEHDAHLYLRRATAVRQLLGGARQWRARVAQLAIDGTRRTLSIDLPAEAEALRDRATDFITGLKAREEIEWRTVMADAGYIAPHWPAPWGLGASPVEQLVIDEQFEQFGIQRPHLNVGAWVLPTLIAHGTDEQKARWIPPTLRGEITWCQMFSEPGAGSDLASLTTKAIRAEGGWLVSGQKVWTTLAHEAHWAICLARSDPEAPKHEGITCFLIDMTTPGIDIRPLRELTGAEMFNEIFLEDVFVPDDCVIGGAGNGWRAARTTLENERVSMASGTSFGLGVEAVVQLASPRLAQQPDGVLLDEIGGLVSTAHSLALLGLRSTVRAVAGAGSGPEASVRKLLGVEHEQRVQEIGLGLLGAGGTVADGDAATWVGGFLGNRCLTIAGGTSEIQRNVIAERLLGLPRDP